MVVVLPTPPFWFATVKTRVRSGQRKALLGQRDAAPGDVGDLARERSRRRRKLLTGSVSLSDVSRETLASWPDPRRAAGGSQSPTVARKTRVDLRDDPLARERAPRRRSDGRRGSLSRPPASSSSTRAPFMKSSSPPRRTSGAVIGISLLSADTARAVTWSSGPIEPGLLGARAQHRRRSSSPSRVGLRPQPVDPALHRLDQHEVDVGPRDREHQAGQPGPAADVARRRPGAAAARAARSSGCAATTAAAARAGRSARAPRRARRGRRVNERASSMRSPNRCGRRPRGSGLDQHRRHGCIAHDSAAVMFHVKHRAAQPRVMTVWRSRPSPSDSEVKPRSATRSCTILRS